MNERLIQYLLDKGLLTHEQATLVRKKQFEQHCSAREILAETGYVTEEQLLDALSAVSRVPIVRLYENPVPVEVRQLVKPDLLRQYVMMPYAFDPDDSGTILVAMNDPMNMRGRDLIAIASKCRIRPFLATTTDILVSIDRYNGTEEMQEAAEMNTQANEVD